MTAAADAQVQNYVDTRFRPRAEQLRALYVNMKDDKALLDDVYTALTEQNPTWTDTNNGNPPHLLSPSDVLAMNACFTALIGLLEGTEAGDYATVLKGCVRPVGA